MCENPAETGLYYLQSRYYDPEVGRFINADNQLSTGSDLTGLNLFAYCGNNPILLADPSGEFPWLIVGTVAVIEVPTVVNHIVNAVNHSNIDKEIEDSYTKETAKTEIDKILSTYSDSSVASFEDNRLIITDSYKVTSRYDRQKISEIIVRTGVSDREYDNMSAEWVGHNVCYRLHIKRNSTQNVDIDYGKDARGYVNIGTKVLEILGWD